MEHKKRERDKGEQSLGTGVAEQKKDRGREREGGEVET